MIKGNLRQEKRIRFTIGLILCDQLRDQFSGNFPDYETMFKTAFEEKPQKFSWKTFDAVTGEFPKDLDSCDGYLISGSRSSVYEEKKWMLSLENFINKLNRNNKPTVGLCFGHQIMAKALGGTVTCAPEGWGIGFARCSVNSGISRKQLALPEELTVGVCHRDQVVKLPAGATNIGSTPHCNNFLIQFTPKMIGFQGHPEFEPAYISALIEETKNLLTPQEYFVALQSKRNAPDNQLIRKAITKFLTKRT
jgi:GMP synthase-like glutamine amidotransferase